jgi:hypothetical protein
MEDVPVFASKDDGLVCVVCGSIHAWGQSRVLDLHAEPLSDVQEGRRGLDFISGTDPLICHHSNTCNMANKRNMSFGVGAGVG